MNVVDVKFKLSELLLANNVVELWVDNCYPVWDKAFSKDVLVVANNLITQDLVQQLENNFIIEDSETHEGVTVPTPTNVNNLDRQRRMLEHLFKSPICIWKNGVWLDA